MATVINTIYPPQVSTSMPAFPYNEEAEVWFSLSEYNQDAATIASIKYIHVSMVSQRNNQNVFAGIDDSENVVYPQLYPIKFNSESMWDKNKEMYRVTIPAKFLKTYPYFNAGEFYKIQIRFDLTTEDTAYSTAYKDPTIFFREDSSLDRAYGDAIDLGKYCLYNQDNFSEWSSGTLIKAILIPTVKLNFEDTPSKLPTTDCQVNGNLSFNKINGDDVNRTDDTEWLNSYKLYVLNQSKDTIYYISDDIIADGVTNINTINTYINLLSSNLDLTQQYYLRLVYLTNNNYTQTIDYLFSLKDYDNTTELIKESTIDEDNGRIIWTLSDYLYTSGKIIIRRASHRSNFTQWELMAAYDLEKNASPIQYIDNTIESLTGYKYQFQYMNGTIIYAPIYSDIISLDFYGALISHGNQQLKISFDFQTSNRSNAISRTKTDTIGNRYPKFTKNAKLKYHTYSISGKISSEDDGGLFVQKNDIFGDSYYSYLYDNQESTAKDEESGHPRVNPHNDWLWEREYRDAVESWLDNSEAKLFRSMTEGNIAVMFDTVAMTPDQTLGRRLYNFTATMYEIGDGNDLDNLSSLGIIDIIDER